MYGHNHDHLIKDFGLQNLQSYQKVRCYQEIWKGDY